MATENDLVKALAAMENLAKGGEVTGKLPKTTAQANGGFSDEGDKTEMGVTDSLEGWASKAMPPAKKDDDDDSSSSDEDDESSSDSDDSVSKSQTITDLIKSNPQASGVYDVSPFIESLVDTVSTSDMQLRKALVAMRDEQTGFNSGLRKSMVAMGNLVLEMKKGMDQLLDTPAGQRRAVLSKSEIVERFEEETPDFSKSQVLDTMCTMVEKSIPGVTSIDVSRYELTNTMEPDVRRAVEGMLRKSM